MGDDESGDYYEKPAHKVSLPSFYLGQYPVTNEQFVPFLNEQGNQEEGGTNWVDIENSFSGARCGIMEGPDGFECIPGLEQHPMIYVNWYGARAYCEWLSDKTGKNYRLPSESEWEYAAQGGINNSPFVFSGSNQLKEVGWYNENSHQETKPVGMKLPNKLGLFDMSGLTWEWCSDLWQDNYKNAPNDGSSLKMGIDENLRTVRGGFWCGNEDYARITCRFRFEYFVSNFLTGFRLAHS
jgi:formylglycine-generating enzyme required for sulfatase activity